VVAISVSLHLPQTYTTILTPMHRSAAPLVIGLLTLVGCAPAPPAAPFVDVSPEVPAELRARPRTVLYDAGPTVLYLNLDGVTVTKALASDAYQNLSFLCSPRGDGGPTAVAIPPFDHAPYGSDRVKVTAELVAKVEQAFRDFALKIVTARPAAPPYEMIIVGGDSALCEGYASGLGGLGPLDCDNKIHGELAFVFAQTFTQLDGLGVAIAHEAAHSFGLVHTTEPCDMMSNVYCAQKSFLDKTMNVAPDHLGTCGQTSTTNSWRKLRDTLGLAPRLDGLVPDSRRVDARSSVEARPATEARPSQLEPPSGGAGCSVGSDEKFLLPVPVILGFLFYVWRIGWSRSPERSRSAWGSSTNSPQQRVTRARTRSL
jgi:hypothetical protein